MPFYNTMNTNIAINSEMKQTYLDYAQSVIVSKSYDYEGNPITFNRGNSVMVSATEMAKPFGKEAKHWLTNQSTKDYIAELANVRNLTFADLVQVKQGSPENGGGTWLHEDVAMSLSLLSPNVWKPSKPPSRRKEVRCELL